MYQSRGLWEFQNLCAFHLFDNAVFELQGPKCSGLSDLQGRQIGGGSVAINLFHNSKDY